MQMKTKLGWLMLLVVLAFATVADAAVLLPFRSAGWKYVLGTTEASNPTDAWRAKDFDDGAWLPATAPVGYASADGGPLELSIQTSLPTSAIGGYTVVFLRKTFVVTNIEEIVQLNLTAQHDDGFVAWANGVEIGRANVPAGNVSISTLGLDHEVTVGESIVSLTSDLASTLVVGTNILAIQLFNVATTSSDIFIDVTLASQLDDPPAVLAIDPFPGSTLVALGFVNVIFTENVTGVDATDLQINGGATTVTNLVQVSPREYTFQFAQPPTGAVSVAWIANPGIVDVDGVAQAFTPGAGWNYTLDPNALPSSAIITEFMADNTVGIRDDDGDRRDWIEIYNPGPVDINLGGWSLTDVQTNLTKWRFPSINLAANRYLIVWASEKNRTNPAAVLHTNFRLGKDAGGYLALVNSQGSIVSEFAAYPAQAQDVSYGRDRVDPNLYGYFLAPTPGAQNSLSGAGFAPEPVLSLDSGVYADASQTLTITVPAGVTVRYTLDATEPTATSTAYTAPVTFTTNMLIKVRAYSSDPTLWPSRVLARTYVMLDPSARDFNSNLPILIVNTHGKTVPQQGTAIFNRPRGTFVVIDTFRGRSSIQGKVDYNGPAQFEIVGQTSAGFAKQPWRVELNDELGNDTDASLLGMPAEADWNLRNPHNDKGLFNDFLGYELWEDMGHYSCRRRFVEMFVNTTVGGKLQYPRDYYGVMVLLEHIETGKDRVNIAKLGSSHTNEPSVTGGYIIKKDKDSVGDTSFITGGGAGHSGHLLKFHDPKPREISVTQSNYIRNYVNRFEASMYAANWTNAIGTNHYSYYIDVDAFVDQHLHVEFTKQIDGYRLSSFYSKDRLGKLKPDPVWDWNLAFGNANYLQGGKTNGWYWNIEGEGMNSGNHIWLRRLIYGSPSIPGTPVAPNTINNGPGDPDFRQKITDRWSVLRDSILNGDRVVSRIDELVRGLTEAADRNWIKYPGVLNAYQWPNPEGLPSWDIDLTKPTYAEIVSEVRKWTKGRYLWMDSQFLPTPGFSQAEGPITAGTSVVVGTAQGTIYYTLDGTDPRLPGGGISPTAQVYSSPLTINANARLVARAYVNPTPLWTPWSAPAAATYVLQTPKLVITEIMYHPTPPPLGSPYTDEDFEYLELKNVGTTSLNLNRFTISGGIEFTFPANVVLGAGQRVLVVKNQDAFLSRYGNIGTIAGQYTGNLANEGNRLIVRGSLREPILDFSYDDDWYRVTDGFGFSLVNVNENGPLSSWGLASSWRPGSVLGGTPGQADGPPPSLPPVVISEALTHSDPAPPTDTIELHNPSGGNADIGGWYLSDDLRNPKKYRIPLGRSIGPNGYATFTEADFNVGGGGNTAFALSSDGDEVYLFSANAAGDLTGLLQGYQFEAQRPGVTFGRYVTSLGQEHFIALSGSSLGSANAAPLIGPIVISEIMYRPADVPANGAYWNDTEDEYIELRNISGASVNLYDPAHTTNTWQLGKVVKFSFPQGMSIPAGGYLLVVNFNPTTQPTQTAAFRAKYGITASVPLVGPYQNSLDNGDGNVSLYMPDNPTTNGVIPLVLVDGVHYRDSAPWPTDADGLGQSLHRLNLSAYGDDPINWTAGGPTPGTGYTSGTGPTFINQPTSAVVQDTGTASATFTGFASGPGPLRYQWLYNGAIINGATNNSLTLLNIQSNQGGEYRLMVFNAYGSAVSAPATLTVLILPKISQHPASQKVTLGGSASFSVIATSLNPPLRYQWYRNGIPIPNATNSVYNLVNVQDPDEGVFSALVSDGNGSILTGEAELKVLLEPILIQPVPPVRVTAVVGDNVTIGIQTRGTKPMLYRWRRILATGAGLVLTNRTLNANSDFLVITNVGTNLHNSTWTVICTNEVYTAQNRSFTNAFLTVLADSNLNGIPDEWESTYFGSPTGADRNADTDGDKMSNYAEYLAGTDPTNAQSYLKVDQITATGTANIQFLAVSNRTYTVEYKDGLDAGVWTRLADVVSRSANWNATVVDPNPSTNRFYRLGTPKK